jgi:hypothetical protein
MSEIKFVENLTLPCNIKAESGWKMIVQHGGKIKAIEIVGWTIYPRSLATGPFGFGSEIALKATPFGAPEFDGSKFLGNTFDPCAADHQIEQSIASWRRVYPSV